jgi:predicted negative regulator of RcsB-dependent stress response
MGDVRLAQGDMAGAFTAYRESLAIAAQLAVTDTSNAVWQWDLSAQHQRIGRVLHAQGDLAGALNAYRESLAVAARLAAADPSNTDWQRGLSVCQGNMGDVRLAQGDMAGALTAYRESLAIAAQLAVTDPSNAIWQRDLFANYWRMARIAEKSGAGGALDWWRKTYEQLSGMKQRGVPVSNEQQFLMFLRQKAGAG